MKLTGVYSVVLCEYFPLRQIYSSFPTHRLQHTVFKAPKMRKTPCVPRRWQLKCLPKRLRTFIFEAAFPRQKKYIELQPRKPSDKNSEVVNMVRISHEAYLSLVT
jgi:hypothetical protein